MTYFAWALLAAVVLFVLEGVRRANMNEFRRRRRKRGGGNLVSNVRGNDNVIVQSGGDCGDDWTDVSDDLPEEDEECVWTDVRRKSTFSGVYMGPVKDCVYNKVTKSSVGMNHFKYWKPVDF